MTPPTDSLAVRAHLVRALRAEMVGPHAEDELLPQRPDAWYLAGFLVPRGTPYGAGVQLELLESLALNEPAGDAPDDGGPADASPRHPPRLPSSLGLSAVVPAGCEALWAELRWGRYHRLTPEQVEAARARTGETEEQTAAWDLLAEQRAENEPDAGAETDASPEADGPKGARKGPSWWQRSPQHSGELALPLKDGVHGYAVPGHAHLHFTVRVVAAPTGAGLPAGSRVVSVFVGNHAPYAGDDRRVADTLFQAELALRCPEGFVPRHNEALLRSPEADQRRVDLQYRDHAEWAVGHNVSAAAETEPPADGAAPTCAVVRSEWLPQATVHRMRADAPFAIELRMEALADLPDGAALAAALANLPTEFTAWIARHRAALPALAEPRRRDVAEDLLEQAELACQRIEAGLDLLQRDAEVFEAFGLANRAMALAARQSGRTFGPGEGPQWRLFQLAFLLLNLRGAAQPEHSDRRAVELLFFPTGGGKTEAYLGVAAFVMALRRLRHRTAPHRGAGVAVLLRYTLRLLTLDQLQRAAALTCALEVLRRERPDRLGPHPFSVGLWVGAKASPNKLADAREQNRQHWQRRTDPRYPLVSPLSACPWCGTAFAESSFDFEGPARAPTALRIYCDNLGRAADPATGAAAAAPCPFSADRAPGVGVPLYAIDEQIYRAVPSFVVGTVDKFASLPWRGESGALFGRVQGTAAPTTTDGPAEFVPRSSASGRVALALPEGLPPPELIVQDELHLITGPLGTVMSLYEVAVEALCHGPDRLDAAGRAVPGPGPKIIASTATARRAGEQVKALFGRGITQTFPPPGPEPDATFFSQVDRSPEQSRLYVGVAAPGRNLSQVLVRVWSTLLSAAWHQRLAAEADPEVRAGRRANPADPYLSLVGYFNNLRELGGAIRTVHEQVAPRTSQLERRRPLGEAESPLFARRYLSHDVHELTSRLSSDQIRRTADLFRAPHTLQGDRADVLLASSMISVGVDIPRLGLMCVTGQPRTVAEYIQATSRVGRAHPGLVVTVHNAYRPRDRSHYERFAAFHQAFYRDVEAAGVTPFSGRALDRALTGAALAFVRHHWPQLSSPRGVEGPALVPDLTERLLALFAQRIAVLVSGEEGRRLTEAVSARLRSLVNEWCELASRQQRAAAPLQWSPWESAGPPALLRTLDADASQTDHRFDRFRAPTSLRDVEPTVHLWVNRLPGTEEE